MEIERLEDWVGQQIVDPDDDKVGKLEDIFYGPGGDDALAAAVKSGLMGRHLRVVPLDGATVTRDHVRIVHGKDTVKDAPETTADADLPSATVASVAKHYDVSLPGGELESAAGRRAREARAREAEEQAQKLEQEAEAKGDEAARRRETADQTREAADVAEREQADAQARADEARRSAEDV